VITQELQDAFFMKEALNEARIAFAKDEVPIGAVIVVKDRIIARAHNLVETLTDVTAHAEMQAITSAAAYIGGKYLKECTLYVTLEPCLMCAAALYWSQIYRIVYGAKDEKRGFSNISTQILHPSTTLTSSILEDECAALLTSFFAKKRVKYT
jgi:tRNA(adenine34) deaminase